MTGSKHQTCGDTTVHQRDQQAVVHTVVTRRPSELVTTGGESFRRPPTHVKEMNGAIIRNKHDVTKPVDHPDGELRGDKRVERIQVSGPIHPCLVDEVVGQPHLHSPGLPKTVGRQLARVSVEVRPKEIHAPLGTTEPPLRGRMLVAIIESPRMRPSIMMSRFGASVVNTTRPTSSCSGKQR